jgi:hypothetical protein
LYPTPCASASTVCAIGAMPPPANGSNASLLCACVLQLLHQRDRLIVNDYTEVLMTLMRFPGGSQPFEFFRAAVTLAENGGRIREVTPPPDAPPPAVGPLPPLSLSDLAHFRAKLVAFYKRCVRVFAPLRCHRCFIAACSSHTPTYLHGLACYEFAVVTGATDGSAPVCVCVCVCVCSLLHV